MTEIHAAYDVNEPWKNPEVRDVTRPETWPETRDTENPSRNADVKEEYFYPKTKPEQITAAYGWLVELTLAKKDRDFGEPIYDPDEKWHKEQEKIKTEEKTPRQIDKEKYQKIRDEDPIPYTEKTREDGTISKVYNRKDGMDWGRKHNLND